ncbi:hypothetical protein FRC15_009720 [Serendipita sp. 397]|nr:hypothetical protein FRC15_009720 [Serendipita sp. 397]
MKPGEKKAGVSNGSNGKADKSKATAPRSLKGWHTRSVAFSHAVLVIPLAIQCLNLPGVDGTRGRAFGWDEKVGFVHGIACGFLWDTVDSIIHFEDIGFILHGIACLTVFLFGYRPFLAYYGPRFLLWELSTPFLNLNWFFDRTRVKGTTIHLLNGVALLISFFSARLVYGTYMADGKQSYNFFRTTYLNRSEIPAALFWTYCIGNVLLNGLNWFWFSKMVKTVRRKFASSR